MITIQEFWFQALLVLSSTTTVLLETSVEAQKDAH